MYGLQAWHNVINSACLYQLAISYTYKVDYAAPINVINTSHFLLMLPVDLFPNARHRFSLFNRETAEATVLVRSLAVVVG